VSGIVVSPLMGHDLASGKGSNFTMQLIEDPGARPPPAINCDKDPAEY
jgi:hypothetical protein